MPNRSNKKIEGALLGFVIFQLVYVFCFFISFPQSFRNAIGVHWNALDGIASWLSTITMLVYCMLCIYSVIQLVMRKHGFLLWFQISGVVAMVGNFISYLLRQISEGLYFDYDIDFYWGLFILALFWTAVWSMYFARSSRVYSYFDEDPTYLRTAWFTKMVKEPTPWVESVNTFYPPYQTSNTAQWQQAPPSAPVYPAQSAYPDNNMQYPAAGNTQPVYQDPSSVQPQAPSYPSAYGMPVGSSPMPPSPSSPAPQGEYPVAPAQNPPYPSYPVYPYSQPQPPQHPQV